MSFKEEGVPKGPWDYLTWKSLEYAERTLHTSFPHTPGQESSHLVFLRVVGNGLQMAHEEFECLIVVPWEIPDLDGSKKGHGAVMASPPPHHTPQGLPLLDLRDLETTLQSAHLGQMEKPRPRVEKGFSKVTEGHLSFLTSFRSVFIRSLESSMRLASMKSLYLSRTQ